MNRRSMFFCTFTLSLFLVALQAFAVPAPKPKNGGTLVMGLAKEPGNQNPFIATGSTHQFVRETSYESLLTRDENDRIIPHLADKYEISAGGTVFTLHLRKGVKFHNGKEMTADDVVWSANHVKDRKNGATGQNMISDAKAIEKIDDYTVRFTLSSPSVVFLAYLSNIKMLPIVPANSLRPGQIKLEKNSFVPGTGPFVLEGHQPGFDTVVKRFPEYWGGPAYLDRIVFRPITDVSNRFNALRSGDVQLADRIDPLDADRVKKGQIQGIQILDEPLGGFQQLIFSYLNPLFHKIEMRQAISLAIDKQRLVDEVFYGHAKKTDLIMARETIWGKAVHLTPHKRDIKKAKALLKAAGYNGQELVYIGRKSSAQFMESFQRMLREAGINIKLEVLESGVLDERLGEGKYDLHSDGANLNSDPAITMIPEYYTNKVEKGRYSNPKVDKLLDSLVSEFNEKKRLTIFRDVALTIDKDVGAVPLYFEVRYLGMSDKVQGFGPSKGHSYDSSGTYFKHAWLK